LGGIPGSLLHGVTRLLDSGAMQLKSPFTTQPIWLVLTECFLLTGMIGTIDFFSSWEISLFVLYGLPIFIGSWYVGRVWGLCLGIVAGLIWYAANLRGNPYQTMHGYVWAALNRAMYFGFVAIGSSAIRQQREETLGRLAAVTRARELEQEIVRAGEREQIRIGQDLHDGICQNLAAIDCAAECLREELEATHSPQAEAAAQIQRFLKETLVEARNLARGMLPVRLETDGLTAALQDLVVRMSVGRACEVAFTADEYATPGSSEISMQLYRIVQEALSNAIRHSGAQSVEVSLKSANDFLILSVEDDGCGFSADDGLALGIGLRAMQNRAQLAGGELRIWSARGSGTRVECRVPVAESGAENEASLIAI
jgi:signal transduction histidine kinase